MSLSEWLSHSEYSLLFATLCKNMSLDLKVFIVFYLIIMEEGNTNAFNAVRGMLSK